MFKRIVALLLTVVLCLSFTACNSGAGNEEVVEETLTPIQKIEQSVLVRPNKNEDFRYNVYTHYVEISECLSTKTNIVIPDTIQGLPVYKICFDAFANQTTFKTLEMSNNIIEIGERAFQGCTNLESITFSENLATLGVDAFRGCTNLREVTTPASLYELNTGIFGDCTRLASVMITPGEEAIGEDGVALSKTIYGGAFAGCTELKVVCIPQDVAVIEDGAFDWNQEKYDNGERITICGAEESQAAIYASTQLLDFKTENEFKTLSEQVLSTQKVSINEVVSSMNWEMQVTGYETKTDEIIHYQGKEEVKEKINNDECVVFVKLAVRNASGTELSINHLDFNVQVDGYERKISTYTTIKNFDNNIRPIQGKYEENAAYNAYIAVKAPKNWEKISIKYMGDVNLESTTFEITNSVYSNPIIPISSDDIPGSGETTTQSGGVIIEEPSTEQVTETTTKVSQKETTTKAAEAEMSTLPF